MSGYRPLFEAVSGCLEAPPDLEYRTSLGGLLSRVFIGSVSRQNEGIEELPGSVFQGVDKVARGVPELIFRST